VTPLGDWPRPAYAWYVVVVLTLAYTCSFIDRQILTLLIEPIRRDLRINDTQVALLGGLAFSIFYTTLGMPLARLADQASRRNLIATGVALWSSMTMACGLARGFWALFLGRVGVGVGEAALSPAAFSLLADYFPPQRLARAVATYSTGVYFGAGLALMIGGTVIELVANSPVRSLPLVGEVFPWQYTFFVVGGLGLPVALLVLTIREPVRRGRATAAAASPTAGTAAAVGPGAPNPSAWPALRAFLAANGRTLVCHIGAFTAFGIAIACYLFWAPSFMIRSYGYTPTRAGLTVGALLFVLGTLGVWSGGWLADRLAAAGRRDAILRAAGIGMLCALPFVVATPFAPTPGVALIGLAGAVFFLAFPQGLPSAALQVMTPNPLRAQVTAIYFFVGNLVANGFGPLLPAALTDYVFEDPAQLRWALAIVCAIAVPMSLVLLRAALPAYAASVARAAAAPASG
jgi:MFS family permease